MAPQSRVLPRAIAGWEISRRIMLFRKFRCSDTGSSSGHDSEIVQQPEHYPLVVEQPVDVAEESVDQGLHGRFPS